MILITEEAGEILIERQTNQFIASASNSDFFVMPSENIAFDELTLYREDSDGNSFIVYHQDPIVDELWTQNILSSYDVAYTLLITDENLN